MRQSVMIFSVVVSDSGLSDIAPAQIEVATLASSEFAAIICTMSDEDQKASLASEWQIAMDIILTEIQAGCGQVWSTTVNVKGLFCSVGLAWWNMVFKWSMRCSRT